MSDEMQNEEFEPVQVVNKDGEVLSFDQVQYAYTREGRRVFGHELPNPQPLEPPLGFIPQATIFEQMRELVQREMRQAEELETEEDANDFEVGDDFDPTSPWELDFEPTQPWAETLREIQASVLKDVPDAPAGGGGAQPPSDGPPGAASPPPPAKPS